MNNYNQNTDKNSTNNMSSGNMGNNLNIKYEQTTNLENDPNVPNNFTEFNGIYGNKENNYSKKNLKI